jgi:hypothetical protein
MNSEAYHLAQSAIADLKSAIYISLETAGKNGLSNAELGRSLGIYGGHIGHEGHISRTLLAMLETENVVYQEAKSKRWYLKNIQSPNI